MGWMVQDRPAARYVAALAAIIAVVLPAAAGCTAGPASGVAPAASGAPAGGRWGPAVPVPGLGGRGLNAGGQAWVSSVSCASAGVGFWRSHRGSSSSAQAASHNVLTVTRRRLRAMGTGGQKKKLPVPSFPGKPRQSPGMPVYSCPGVVGGPHPEAWRDHGPVSPHTQGCPYSWTPTSSPCAETLSITAVACSSGRCATSPRCSPGSKWAAVWARRRHRFTRSARQAGVRSAGDSCSKVLVTGRAPTASKLSATLATICRHIRPARPWTRCPRC